MATANAPRHDVSKAILLNYGNGPVLVKPKAYIIFWGYKTYGDTDGVAKLLQQYSKVMGGSSHNDIYTQYYEIVNSKTIDITNPKKQLGGVWFDDTNAVPAHPTDSQVAAEALNGVAKFGYHANGSYVVATPTGHSSAGFGSSVLRVSQRDQLQRKARFVHQPALHAGCRRQLRCELHHPALGRERRR